MLKFITDALAADIASHQMPGQAQSCARTASGRFELGASP